jgi:hypothetical protein
MLSKERTVFSRSNAGIVGSNPTQGIDVCMRSFCVCVVLSLDSGLATVWSPVRGVLPTVYRIKKLKNYQGPTKDSRAIEINISNRSRDNVVGIATNYKLDDRGVGVRIPVGSIIFSSPHRPDRLWGSPNLLSNGYRGLIPRGYVCIYVWGVGHIRTLHRDHHWSIVLPL